MRTKLIIGLCCVGIIGLLSGCVAPPPKMNALQIQAMQTRDFNTSKTKAFNAVMTVFQNDGYTIGTANKSTGYITAKGVTQSTPFVDQYGRMPSSSGGFTSGMLKFMAGGDNYNSRNKPIHTNYSINASAYVTPIKTGKKPSTKIRISYIQNKVVSGGDTSRTSLQVLDPNLYQKAFNDIRQQLFIAPAMQ